MAVLVTPSARHGKPAHARTRVFRTHVRRETVAAPVDRRHDLRHLRQHRGALPRAHACLCAFTRRGTNGPRSMASGSSTTMPNRMPLAAQTEPSCTWKSTATPNGRRRIEPMRPRGPACPRHPLTAPTVSAVDPSDAASTSSLWSESAPTIRPSRITRPCASAACGWNPYVRDQQGLAWYEALSPAAASFG